VKTDPLEASWAKVEAAAVARGIGQTRGKVGHGLAQSSKEAEELSGETGSGFAAV